MYWVNLIRDIKIWYKFAKIAKQNREFLSKNNLRVDYLGRIYTVVNLPEELQNGNEYLHQSWVLENLKPFTNVLLKIGIADYAYPEIIKINQPNTCAYLVIMYPEAESLSFTKFIYNVFLLFLFFVLIKIIYKFFILNPSILNHFKKIIQFIF